MLVLRGEQRKDGWITKGLGLVSVPFGGNLCQGWVFCGDSGPYYDSQHALRWPARCGGAKLNRPGSVAARERLGHGFWYGDRFLKVLACARD